MCSRWLGGGKHRSTRVRFNSLDGNLIFELIVTQTNPPHVNPPYIFSFDISFSSKSSRLLQQESCIWSLFVLEIKLLIPFHSFNLSVRVFFCCCSVCDFSSYVSCACVHICLLFCSLSHCYLVDFLSRMGSNYNEFVTSPLI